MAKQETSHQARLDQHYQRIRAKLETLSAEQLNMHIHEVKWLLKQLGNVIPDPESPNLEMSKQSTIIEKRVVFIQEALILERARRQSLHLQALITGAGTADLPDTPEISKEVLS